MSFKQHTKKLVAGGAAAVGLTLGVAVLAGAAGPGSPDQSPPAQTEDDDVQDPAYESSVTAPESEGQSEADEAAALEGLATITPDQARDAALAVVPGTAGDVELDNENGNVVYSVEITDANGKVIDVKVDPGNATVLHQDAGDDAEEANEANEPPEANEAAETGAASG